MHKSELSRQGKWSWLKSCSIKNQNPGMLNIPLSGGADEKVTTPRRADYLCLETGRIGYVRAGCLLQAGYFRCHLLGLV